MASNDEQVEATVAEVLTVKERTARYAVMTKISELSLYLGQKDDQGNPVDQNYKRAKPILGEMKPLMDECEIHAIDRMGKEKDQEIAGKLSGLWLKWKAEQLRQLDNYDELYKQADPGDHGIGIAKAAAAETTF